MEIFDPNILNKNISKKPKISNPPSFNAKKARLIWTFFGGPPGELGYLVTGCFANKAKVRFFIKKKMLLGRVFFCALGVAQLFRHCSVVWCGISVLHISIHKTHTYEQNINFEKKCAIRKPELNFTVWFPTQRKYQSRHRVKGTRTAHPFHKF